MKFSIKLVLIIIILSLILIKVKTIPFDKKIDPVDKVFGDSDLNKYVTMKNFNPSNSKNIYRIVILGDSVVESNCPMVDVLEIKLNNHFENLNINVINAGLSSQNILDLYNMLAIMKENVNIDMLFISSGWNEHWYNRENSPCIQSGCYEDPEMGKKLLELTKSANQMKRYLASQAFLYWLKENSKTCNNLFNENPEIFLEGLDHYDSNIYRVSLNEYEEKIVQIIEEQRKNGIITAFVTAPDGLRENELPYKVERDCVFLSKEDFYQIHHSYIEKLINLSEEYNFPLLDLNNVFDKLLDKRDLYFNNPLDDPIHPNQNGKEVCTEEYYNKIVELLENESNK